MKQVIEKLLADSHLSFDEAYNVMTSIMEGNATPVIISSFLTAMKAKGETAEEIAGFAKAMREHSIKIKCENPDVIDVCGTGGDNSGSFNISTATAFVVAACGVPVAKHGNRSISSNSGSADILSQLGVNINMPPQVAEKALNEIGITFLFAPIYHPAMRFAAPVRQELKIRTVFNILGPLTNPVSLKRQMIGTFNNETAKLLCEASKYLDYESLSVICNNNQFDEIFLEHETSVFELNNQKDINNYKLNHNDFDYEKVSKENLKGGTPEENARLMLDIFQNHKKNGAFHTVCANAALALKISGKYSSLSEAVIAAEEAILSNKAFEKLEQLIKISNS
ncbi:Anthranilate phosphoribosyltransferase [Ignavibacterium album JCM 16511]|uniref:Anthranilate phosphoribosyltransferase n=1 Tax=Ignavibacterium album (strain DSM 19864 / JCM 16511 / NBRC 101810 / Mat9-16) TaxID=945713 RepID=I0AM86_IGNAJ|nr:anthranilate phosphoribosyltransferase [Ignavibacterium album]AFH50093.1 Anthranilate phosphoribosyltransferase [Ignavibacterium album JCM 16511]